MNLTDQAEEREEIASALVTQRDLLLIIYIHGKTINCKQKVQTFERAVEDPLNLFQGEIK